MLPASDIDLLTAGAVVAHEHSSYSLPATADAGLSPLSLTLNRALGTDMLRGEKDLFMVWLLLLVAHG